MGEQLQIIEPKQVGPYVFKATVGDGAFSVVKLVCNVDTEKYFACKIVPKSRLSTTHLEKRFETEIRIDQQMHHPGIVELIDLLKDENNYYVIMEFCPNGELFQFIVERVKLNESDAKKLLVQILETLKYVHDQGVSHRDLKPENLLIDTFGRVKISDFGLSRFMDSNGLVNTPCGSPCYASPECISGKPYDGKTTDVWSIGVILYAMLTGQLPWTKRNQTQLFKQIKSGDFSIPQGLTDEASDLILKLMTVDNTKRITIEEALMHPWLKDVPSQYGTNAINFGFHVSLKCVDQFFGEEPDRPLYDESEVVTNSVPMFSITQTLNFIQNRTGRLPKMRTRTHKDVSKPIKISVLSHTLSSNTRRELTSAHNSASHSKMAKAIAKPHVSRRNSTIKS